MLFVSSWIFGLRYYCIFYEFRDDEEECFCYSYGYTSCYFVGVLDGIKKFLLFYISSFKTIVYTVWLLLLFPFEVSPCGIAGVYCPLRAEKPVTVVLRLPELGELSLPVRGDFLMIFES